MNKSDNSISNSPKKLTSLKEVASDLHAATPPSRLTSSSFRRWKSKVLLIVMGGALLTCLVPLVSLLYTLLANGLSSINWKFLTAKFAPVGETGGILHAIVGSFCLLILASLIAVPIGLLNGIYLSQKRDARLAKFTRLMLDVMSGIPAIIVGVFVYTIMVQKNFLFQGTGFSMISGAIALAIIMLPIFARTSEQAMRSIPTTYTEAGLALGLPRRRVIVRILLRSAMPAVVTGLFLSIARVAGEAAPLLFTAFGSNDLPDAKPGAIVSPVGSLPQLLFDFAQQPFPERVRQAWGAAFVLVSLILGTRLITNGYLKLKFGSGEHH